ncbi:MAG TPA: hypothetical protein VLV50_01845 [Stellaceae bacterium]|nr:hypothetical protein [Stellaceae bacterium]
MTGARAWRLTVVTILGAVLASCTNPHAPFYDAPTGLTGATGATVGLSQNPNTPSGADGDTRIVTVDDQPVSALDFDQVLLQPGEHTLGVEYFGAAAAATVPITATFRAGARYQARGRKEGPCDAVVWLQQEGADQALSKQFNVHLTAKPAITGAPVFAVACN